MVYIHLILILTLKKLEFSILKMYWQDREIGCQQIQKIECFQPIKHSFYYEALLQQSYQSIIFKLIKKRMKKSQVRDSKKPCPYLSTVKKHLLDFDFEKICSISLANTNIYACLACGRYFQGRSESSHAYKHSIELSHYVFMNLQTSKIYCLPDDYEVESHTMEDVKFNLNPIFTAQMVEKLQQLEQMQYNMDGKQYIPGVVGINNLGMTDYATSVIYLLNAVDEVRKYFLLNNGFQTNILEQFGLLLRKIWNPKNFKGIVSPHQFLQTISDVSSKQFKIGKQGDPVSFLLWILDQLSKNIKKKEKKKTAFDLQSLFRGKLKTSIIEGIKDSYQYEQVPSKIQQIFFSLLKLEFPEQGVFNKSQNQVSLDSLMQKYVGRMGQNHPKGLRYAKIIQFPLYLTLVFKRFKNNGYMIEKDCSHLLYGNKLSLQSDYSNAEYKLISQICHEGDAKTGKYKTIFCLGKKWFEVEDLEAKQILQNQAMLAQPYIQTYSLIKTTKKKE